MARSEVTGKKMKKFGANRSKSSSYGRAVVGSAMLGTGVGGKAWG
jgi:hypothetical protein